MSSNVEVRDGVALTQLGDTLLVIWREAATLDRWNYQLNRIETMAASRAAGILCLTLIAGLATPPDAAVRQQMTDDYRRMGTMVRRLVVVPLGDSVWIGVVRALVRAILLLSGHARRQRVAGTVDEGLAQIRAAAGPETPTLRELKAGLVALSSALGLTLPAAA